MAQVYEGKFNFHCFFKDMKEANEKGELLNFNYANYIDREDCANIPKVNTSPLIDPPNQIATFDNPAPSIENFFKGKLYKDKYLEAENEDGVKNLIYVFDRNISRKEGIIDPNLNTSFGIGDMSFTNGGKAIQHFMGP